jgi:hypothetical protein
VPKHIAHKLTSEDFFFRPPPECMKKFAKKLLRDIKAFAKKTRDKDIRYSRL